MKRPGPATMLFGNPIVAVLLLLGSAYMLYIWWTQTDTSSSVQPLLAGFIVWMIFTSCGQVAEYKAWQRRWAAMGGDDPDAAPANGILRLRKPLALIIWLGSAWWLLEYRYLKGTTDYDQFALGWGALTMLVVCYWLYRITRTLGHKLDKKREKHANDAHHNFIVKVHPSKPAASPDARSDVIQALPENCRVLLKRAPNQMN